LVDIDDKTLKRMVIGSVALFFLSILSPIDLLDFLLWAVTGTMISVFVLVPVNRYIITRKFQVVETTGFVIGIVVLAYLYLYVYKSITEMLIFVMEWLVTYNLISVFFDFLEDVLP